jgi:hypothetical protein
LARDEQMVYGVPCSNSRLELKIEKLIYGGDGLARLPSVDPGRAGKAVFVPFTIAGEGKAHTYDMRCYRSLGSRPSILTPGGLRPNSP